MRDYLALNLVGILGGLLSSSWCFHLYLLIAAVRAEDRAGMYYELAVVVLHELLVLGLVVFSRIRTTKNRKG